MSDHTKGPWYRQYGNVFGIGRVTKERSVAACGGYASNMPEDHAHEDNEANADRIVACVNACEGISNEALEAGVIQEMAFHLEAILRAYIETVDATLGETQITGTSYAIKQAKAVLAKLGKETSDE